jgi:L-alanine-DL-glutamate epimerase-like enolase superfamily enzyme
MAAIDTALWDLKARKLGQPLHLLAGGGQDSVPLYTTEGGWLHLDEAALVEDAERAKGEGFGGCKLKIGRPIHEDVRTRRRPSRANRESPIQRFLAALRPLALAALRGRRLE